MPKMTAPSPRRGVESVIRESLTFAFRMTTDPWNSIQEASRFSPSRTVSFLLITGAVTALLTPLQSYIGFEDINGLHAGGQAEYLARDISSMLELGILWRPILIKLLYLFILFMTTGYLHFILRALGGKGTVKETLAMIACGDAPGLLFGWIPYFATVSAIWAATIQLLLGPVVVHRLHWTRSVLLFSFLFGLGLIAIALCQAGPRMQDRIVDIRLPLFHEGTGCFLSESRGVGWRARMSRESLSVCILCIDPVTMGFKTISLSDLAYERLASMKKEGESFTDVVMRLCSHEPKKSLVSFAGAWVMTDMEEKEMLDHISELWSGYEKDLPRHGFPGGTASKSQ